MVRYIALLALAAGYAPAQSGKELPPVHVRDVSDVFAPIIVGRPPADAYIGLVRLDNGEIRHYNYSGGREGKGPLYIYSQDGGLQWNTRELAPDYIGADQRSPVSGAYMRMFVHWTSVGQNDHVPVEGSKRGLYLIRSKGGLDGTWSMTRVHEEPLRTIKPPIFIRGGKRILVPCQREDKFDGGPVRNAVGTFYSDDDGATWKLSNFVTAPHFVPSPPHEGPRWEYGTSEATVVELKDGRVWMLARTSHDVLYESYSTDGGATWGPMRPSRFPATQVMPTLGRLRDGRILLVWSSTLPLPERKRDEAARFFIGARAHDGRSEDVFTNRDVLHAAISDDDGGTWRGFRELVLNPRRNDSDYAETGGQDRSVHQSQFVEQNQGKVLVSCGQHPLHRLLLLFDPAWLNETRRSSSFENGLTDWSVHKYVAGIRGHCAFNRRIGATLIDHPDQPGKKVLHVRRRNDPALVTSNDGAVWNFPAARAGVFRARLRVMEGAQGFRISLLDRWVNPTDLTSGLYGMYNLRVPQTLRLKPGGWHTLTMEWSDGGTCQVSIDGQRAGTLPLDRKTLNGINYVHFVSEAATEDKAGFLIESVSAEAR